METGARLENAADARGHSHYGNDEAFRNDQQIPDVQPGESELVPGRHQIWWRPLALLFLMTFVGDIGYFVNIAPQTRLFEDLACRRYYSESNMTLLLRDHGGSPDEKLCKIPAVQDVVAELFGMQALFDGIVGILVGIYYGALADKIGRRPIMVLSAFGMLLGTAWILFICWMDFPLRLTWLSSLFMFVGGGSTVASAIITMVLTDVSPTSLRSRVFLFFNASNLSSEVISPLIASYFMEKDVWIPLSIGLVSAFVTVLIAISIPETLAATPHIKTGLIDDDAISFSSSEREDASSNQKRSPLAVIGDTIKQASTTLKYIYRSHVLIILVVTFLVSDFARQSLQVLLQYVSMRYDITLAKTNYLLSWRATAALIHNVALMPAIDHLLEKKLELPAQVKDLGLARASILLLTVSFAMLVVAPSIWFVVAALGFYTLGSTFGVFSRALMSSLVEADMLGTLYTTLAIMDTVGSMSAGPVMAEALKISFRLGGILRGIPYIFSFVLCALTALMLMRLRINNDVDTTSHTSEEQDALLSHSSVRESE